MKPTEILTEWSEIDHGIKTFLTNKGYRFLGDGADQAAFLQPDGQWVLKVFGTQNYAHAPDTPWGEKDKPTFSRDHMMFFYWVKYCQSHSDNKFLPKFGGFESFYWHHRFVASVGTTRSEL